jgi:sugar fermentation stimulation protein A
MIGMDEDPVSMKGTGFLVEGRFLSRDNRFRVTVQVGGQPVAAHLPNSGRLGELLVPGRRVLLVERTGPNRKTGYDLNMIEVDNRWISLDARLPNDLVEKALRSGQIAPLTGYPTLRREVTWGHSRFDFQLEAPGKPPCLLEVKSVTLVIDGLGCFPDAVTARGKRHVEELSEAIRAGYRAAVLFVVQRDDATGMRPHDESDPEFGRALREAARRGVEVYAYRCHVEPGQVVIDGPLPVHLEPV